MVKKIISISIVLLVLFSVFFYVRHYTYLFESQPKVNELVAFLKASNSAGAVVVEYKNLQYQGRVWIVKKDGSMELLTEYDLTKYPSVIGGAYKNFSEQVKNPIAENVLLSPDKSAVLIYSDFKKTKFDLSPKYFTVEKKDFWSKNLDLITGRTFSYFIGSPGVGFSPDGKKYASTVPKLTMYWVKEGYTFGKDMQESELINSGVLYNPLDFQTTLQKEANYGGKILWSPDSKTVVVIKRDTIIGKFDANTGKSLFESDKFPNTLMGKFNEGDVADGIIDYLPENYYFINSMTGTYLAKESNGDFAMQNILPNNIKLVGIIP